MHLFIENKVPADVSLTYEEYKEVCQCAQELGISFEEFVQQAAAACVLLHPPQPKPEPLIFRLLVTRETALARRVA